MGVAGAGASAARRADRAWVLTKVVLYAAVAVAFVTEQTMVVVAVAAWALAWWCRRYVRAHRAYRARRAGGHRSGPGGRGVDGLDEHLCAAGVLYLVPIAAALSFWALLAVCLHVWAGAVDAGSLLGMEQVFGAVSGFFSGTVKLSEQWVFVLLAGVQVVVTVLLVLARGRPRALRAARGLDAAATVYTRYSGPVAAGLATLAAVSLFGMATGAATQDLSLRLIIARQGYAEVSRTVEAAITTRVTHDLYERITTGMPAHWTRSVTAGDQLDPLIQALGTDLAVAHAQGIAEPAADADVAAAAAARDRAQTGLGAYDDGQQIGATVVVRPG